MWLLLALPAALFQVLRNASMKRLGHVDTSNVDRQALRAVAPGDLVTVTGDGGTTTDRFVAQSVQPRR